MQGISALRRSSSDRTLECEELLIRRSFEDSLASAYKALSQLPNPEESKEGPLGRSVRERSLCVAVQALTELGRGEEAFDLVFNNYPKPANPKSAQFIPSGLRKLLFRLRLFLDNGDPEKAEKILAPYIADVAMFGDRSAAILAQGCKRAVHNDLDSEVVELFLLDCILPLRGREAAEAALEAIAHVLPEDFGADLKEEIKYCNAYSQKKKLPKREVAPVAHRAANPGQKAQSSSSHVENQSGALQEIEPVNYENDQEATKSQPLATVSKAGATDKQRTALSPAAGLESKREKMLKMMFMASSGVAAVALGIILSNPNSRERLRRFFARLVLWWKRSAHVWGPLIAVFAFLASFIAVI